MTHIEAMKQALDALGAYMGATDKEEDEKAHSLMAAAFFKLKEAIAEAENQEPYAYTYLGIKADDSQHGPHLCWKPEYMDAMSASKGAVAIPLYTRPQPTDEPVAWNQDVPPMLPQQKDGETFIVSYEEPHPKEEQEPVKIVRYNCVCGKQMKFESVNGVVAPKREWVGLTDEEMQDIWNRHATDEEMQDIWNRHAYMEMMRTIEAKLKEKNT